MNRTRKLSRTLTLLAAGAICLQFGGCSGIIAQVVLPLALQLASVVLQSVLTGIVGVPAAAVTAV